MNSIRIVVIGLMLLANQLFAQFSEDFSDNNLTVNPSWIGDLDDFITNQDGELQLNADTTDSSVIYSPFTFTGDITWEIDFKLDFSPSRSNQLKIDLFSMIADSLIQTNLWIEIGESGSEDAITLYGQNSPKPLAKGIAGRYASNPDVKLRASLSNSGFFIVMSKLDTEDDFITEFFTQIEDIAIDDYFFGIQCDYTSSRANNFFFRSVTVSDDAVEDFIAPILLQSTAHSTQICLQFNEMIDENLSLEELVIQVNDEVNENIIFEGSDIKIINDGTIPQSELFISITGLSDRLGNRLDTIISAGSSILPSRNEIIINELLFNPIPGGDDFLEILNISNKSFDLEGLVILNTQNNRSVTIDESIMIGPSEIIAFSPNKSQLIEFYPSADSDQIYNFALPSFNNDGGSVQIKIGCEILDIFSFNEDLHHPLLNDKEGVSLERTDPNEDTSNSAPWASASETSGYATPGIANSTQRIETVTDNLVVLSADSFSPNGDGDNDELEITITPQANSIGSIVIYDQSGNKILKLITNSLLGSEDKIIWNGRLDDGTRAPIGIYIIRVEVFDTTGQVFDVKKAVALVDFIN